jgi:hypothetical protein
MSEVYSFKDYDKYLCLKPPAEFWLVLVFYLRPLVLKISTFQMGRGGSKTDAVSGLFDIAYPDNFSFFLGVMAILPAVLIVIALAKRKPGATDFVKKIWRNSVKLLMLAAVLNIVVILLPLVLGKINSIHLLGWVQLAVTALIMGYLLKSQRLRDTFADFPVESGDEKTKVKKT